MFAGGEPAHTDGTPRSMAPARRRSPARATTLALLALAAVVFAPRDSRAECANRSAAVLGDHAEASGHFESLDRAGALPHAESPAPPRRCSGPTCSQSPVAPAPTTPATTPPSPRPDHPACLTAVPTLAEPRRLARPIEPAARRPIHQAPAIFHPPRP